MRRRVIGVDFSGAADAGRLIWIAGGKATPDGLALDSCVPARALPGGAATRGPALAALVRHIGQAGDAAIGMDFPFSLPARFVTSPDWPAFVLDFPTRYSSPAAFREAMRQASPDREIRRRTDSDAKTPFCVWNLRLYRQTWHGIADVLAPLIDEDAVRAAPMQAPRPGKPLLLETCPASLLKAEGLYAPYKGRSAAAHAQRAAILEALESLRLMRAPSPSLGAMLLDDPGGDALDAVLAAICAMRGCADPNDLKPRDRIDRLEARVFY